MTGRARAAGRPRSQEARIAVLRAVDDMLVESGYAAMTMKGIAERAGVGRQTVYRWWQSKAQILLEASSLDAKSHLATAPQPTASAEVECFLTALVDFLTASDAGLAYRALLGEAQHDAAVAALLRDSDVLGDAAAEVIGRLRESGALAPGADTDTVVADLVGPVVYRILAQDWRPSAADIEAAAGRFLGRRAGTD